MPSVLFAGGKLDSLVIAGTTVDSTTAGTFDGAYTDASISTREYPSNYISNTFRDSSGAATTVTTGQTLWFHCDVELTHTTTANTAILFVDGSLNPWFQLRATTSTGVFGLYGNTGTGGSPVWTLLGSTFTLTLNVRITIDISLTLGSPHSATLYVNGSAVSGATGTFTQASLTALAQFYCSGTRTGNDSYYSQILATEGIPTTGAKVAYTKATGAGTTSGWTGAASDINETINSDVTTLTAASAGLKSTFAWGDVSVPVGSVIKDVFIWSRAKNDGAAPTNIATVVRSAGTDYAGSNMAGIGVAFAPALDRRPTDPATGVAWTQTGWNAAEVGVLSA